jgi:SdpC family antimicrobial peptide
MITTFIRKHLMNAYTSIPMLVCLLFATWNSYGKRPANAVNFSGEEMFRGLFFIEGKYAEAIPELKSMGVTYLFDEMSLKERNEVEKFRNQILNSIQNDNPQFFNHFKDVILTEDPTKIKEELSKTHDLINQKIQKFLNISEAEFVSIQQKFTKSVNATIHKIDKKFIKDFEKELAIKSLDQQMLLMPICIIMMCDPPIVIVQDSVAGKKSDLLTEQIVASVCAVSDMIKS